MTGTLENLAQAVALPSTQTQVTAENLAKILENDTKIKVAGIDCDGILRGKVMAKEKFLSILKSGFGFSSAIFGWDMHDMLYTTDTKVTSAEEGYADFIAIPDLQSFRRIPWENNIPFVLLRFEVDSKPVTVCSRSILNDLRQRLDNAGMTCTAGGETTLVSVQPFC